MEHKKFEELIDLIINENEEKARELFHDIVVEKSREIYESIMDEEMHGEEGLEEGDPVEGMMSEIEAEEQMSEGDDEAEVEFDHDAEEAGDDLTHDLEADDDMGEEGEGDKIEDLEDRVVDVEDELDELLSKFNAIMGKGEEDMGGEEVAGGEEDMMEAADEEDDEEDVAESSEDDEEAVEESIAEAVTLKKVSVTHGDNGSNTKSPALHEPKVKTAGVKPVMSKGTETVPTGPKGPSNVYTKGEKEVPGAGNFKNVPGKDNFKEKGDSAPKPVTSQASGVNTKSPVSKG
jgi:hypothetical protein